MQNRAVFFASLAFLALACGDDGTGGSGGSGAAGPGGSGAGGSGAASNGGLPCDVAELLAETCQSCHASTPKFGAPMSLVTRADLLAAPPQHPAATVGEALVGRISDTAEPMPPPPDLPLDAASKAILEAYVAAGMPESDEACGGAGGGGAGGMPPLGCEPDISLTPSAPFEMPSDADDLYVCFGVEAPSDVARHITAISPRIDNESIIHHILLLQSTEPVSANGEPCDFVNIDWKLVYAWGPGTPALELPEEAGFPLGPSDPGHFVIQIHYNNIQGLVGETDQSGIDFCTTTELRANDADIAAFGGTQFDPILPNSTQTTTCETPVPALVDPFFPVTIFQSWPHMHQLGRQFTSVIEKADGSTLMLADVPNYDFEYQVTYPNPNYTLDVGDTVRTSCTWENTTQTTANFGENTTDEMCFNFVAYYPRVTATQWHWLLPSSLAQCQ